MQRHEVAVLRDALLKQDVSRSGKMLAQGHLKGVYIELFDAASALSVNGLHHENGVLGGELVYLLIARN